MLDWSLNVRDSTGKSGLLKFNAVYFKTLNQLQSLGIVPGYADTFIGSGTCKASRH